MSQIITKKSNKKIWYIVIPIVLLLVIFRFLFTYLMTDGYNGISLVLPVLMMGIILFWIASCASFACWVYYDCKQRNDDVILWPIIIIVATPFIGLLVYFLRRQDLMQNCLSCGHKISFRANYCEECGYKVTPKEDFNMTKQNHHLTFIITGTICIILMMACLTCFIVSAATPDNINNSVTSDKPVWNTGVASMNFETKLAGVWNLKLRSASRGFIKECKMKITDTSTETLYADIQCDSVEDGNTLTLWIVQGDTSKPIDVTNLTNPLEYSLEEFESGNIYVRLQIDGVKDITSKIYIE